MTAPPVWTNWAGTVSCDVAVAAPASVGELQRVVAAATERGQRVKPVGAGHSFTAIAATDGLQLDLRHLAGIVHADRASGLVTVLAGTRLHDLNEALWQLGLSMTNLGDIDVQTVSGAVSTGTHGTGARFGGIATQLRALELVLADGALLRCSAEENPEIFAAARVGLGALGVVATVTLQCEPAFALAASEAPASLDDVLADLDANVLGNDHFEFYWFPHTRRTLTKRNNRVLPRTGLRPLPPARAWLDDRFLSNTVFDGVNRLTTRRPGLIPRANAIASGALSARDFVDRSYRVFASPRTVRFREMEYAVPRDAVPHVLAEIERWLARSGELVGFPVEVRFAAADDIWLSTAYERESGYVAVHQYHRREHERYFAAVERIATDVGGRPHWGKLHGRDAASLRAAYPRFDEFVAVRDKLDPGRTFDNDYLRRVLG
ncbi:D-arabinono-1,4-lactone oxidase [Jatrophihabitans endophyticus]|uniref:D-arabinono-1,4-lactone oxidase n=1 Tax=Jatrophihabitans endophyticus TaxID=1206085 RepID=UPI0019EF9807|nr:D-arabinono-1,4-lactone oxidase [Jatrophihabitans endophyticus]MBE7188679.1 FAD-binding protein [Jatrophihabitans endophyticus]